MLEVQVVGQWSVCLSIAITVMGILYFFWTLGLEGLPLCEGGMQLWLRPCT